MATITISGSNLTLLQNALDKIINDDKRGSGTIRQFGQDELTQIQKLRWAVTTNTPDGTNTVSSIVVNY